MDEERKTIGYFGECIACDDGEGPKPLFLDIRAGDPVNVCEACAKAWADEIMRGVRERADPRPGAGGQNA